ncbi:MAG: hypothetical protein H6737_29945 [Alphaproteobacteria bacterium]|nr:hypothetical protein [Alphaproteobacteria bacterium]
MLALLAILAGTGALAAEPPPPTESELKAEAYRLSGEMHRAAQKNAWERVERYYNDALATGMPLGADAHMTAAEAAKTRGDLGRMYARLVSALRADPANSDASQRLAGLDAIYGRVQLKAVKGATLEDYEHPFDPNQIRAVDYAIATMRDTGEFVGLLPPGPYSIDGDPFEVVAGQVLVLDLSPPPPPPPEKKPKKR